MKTITIDGQEECGYFPMDMDSEYFYLCNAGLHLTLTEFEYLSYSRRAKFMSMAQKQQEKDTSK